jgi:hypothetical protein
LVKKYEIAESGLAVETIKFDKSWFKSSNSDCPPVSYKVFKDGVLYAGDRVTIDLDFNIVIRYD